MAAGRRKDGFTYRGAVERAVLLPIRAPTLLALSIAVSVLFAGAHFALMIAVMIHFSRSGGSAPDEVIGLVVLAPAVILWLLHQSMLWPAATRAAILDAQSEAIDLGETIRAALGGFRRSLVAGMVAGLAQLIGTALVVVPGLIVLSRWYVAAPAAVEGLGLFDTLARSERLSAGRRWKVLSVALTCALLTGAAAAFLGYAFAEFVSRPMGGFGRSMAIVWSFVILGFYAVAVGLIAAVAASGPAATYVHLARTAPDEGLAKVFD